MTNRPTLPKDTTLLLLLLALLLFTFQFVTLVKLNVIAPAVSFRTLPRFLEALDEKVDLDWLDGLQFGLILVTTLAIAVLEIWKRRLTLFLEFFFASERSTLFLLSFFILLGIRYYFARGDLSWAADAPQHIDYACITSQALSRGELPHWTNYLAGGTPYLQFYGFLFFYLVGLLTQIIQDFTLSMKLALAASHLLSGIGMYLFIRFLTHSRRAGFVGSLAYVLSFWHVQQVLIMGRLPLSLFYGLLPWPFYFFERLRFPWRRETAALGGALTLGGLALTHPGYGFWATALFALYAFIRLCGRYRKRQFRTQVLLTGGLFAGGLLIGSFLTLGMLLEKDSTGLQTGFHIGGIPGPTWHHVLVWSNFRFWLLPMPAEGFHWYGGYLGLSLFFVAALCIPGLFATRWRWKLNPTLAATALFILALLLTFAQRLPPLRWIEIVQAMPAGRYLLFVVFTLALAFAVGAKILFIRRRNPARITGLLVLLVAIDLGSTSFVHPYIPPNTAMSDYFAEFREEAEPFHQRGELPNYRIFWARGDIHPYFAYGRLLYSSQTPLAHGFHPGDLLTVRDFINPLERFLSYRLKNLEDEQDLTGMEDWPIMAGALRLLNVHFLIATQADHKTVKLVDLHTYTPIVVSSRLEPFPSEQITEFASKGLEDYFIEQGNLPGFEELSLLKETFPTIWLVRQIGLPPTANTCQKIMVRNSIGERDLATHPKVRVLEHRVYNDRADLRVDVTERCFARLSYGYFPSIRVEVDGVSADLMETGGHFIALEMEPGEHHLVITPGLSLLRRVILFLDLAFAFAAVCIWIYARRNSIPPRRSA